MKKSNIVREVLGYAVVIGLSLATIRGEIGTVEVRGDSMYPLINDGQIVTTMNSLNYKEGQIVVAGKDGKVYIKRIYGTEGDYIKIYNNDVLINDVLVKRLEGINQEIEYTLKKGEYFLLGDNPETEYIITDIIYSRVEGVKYNNASN